MPDPKAYTTRAALAGLFEFLEILNEGANHYSAAIVDIVNAAPHDDLPLIIAALHLTADSLRTQVTTPEYVDFLLDLFKRSCSTMVVSVRVPKRKEGEPHE